MVPEDFSNAVHSESSITEQSLFLLERGLPSSTLKPSRYNPPAIGRKLEQGLNWFLVRELPVVGRDERA